MATDKPVNTLDDCLTSNPHPASPPAFPDKLPRGRQTTRGMDPELAAMHKIDALLKGLKDREAKLRVLKWVNGVYSIDMQRSECNAVPMGQS